LGKKKHNLNLAII